jgi:hypothetical protein
MNYPFHLLHSTYDHYYYSTALFYIFRALLCCIVYVLIDSLIPIQAAFDSLMEWEYPDLCFEFHFSIRINPTIITYLHHRHLETQKSWSIAYVRNIRILSE